MSLHLIHIFIKDESLILILWEIFICLGFEIIIDFFDNVFATN